jgi:hypothetical protein
MCGIGQIQEARDDGRAVHERPLDSSLRGASDAAVHDFLDYRIKGRKCFELVNWVAG